MLTMYCVDNITPPLAACLGDLITLFIMALLGSMLVGAMDTPLPLICVIVMSIAAGWFTQRVMRNRWVKQVAKGGWAPLVGHVPAYEMDLGLFTSLSDWRDAHL